MKVDSVCRKTARVRIGFSRSINALDELPESCPSWADSVDERIDSLGIGMKEALTYTPQTLTDKQQTRARANIRALPELVIRQFWSKDHSVSDIRNMLVGSGYGVISKPGDDCNVNGVIINREIVFPCMVLSGRNFTEQICNLVLLDGAGRTLDITVHNSSGVLAYRWHQPILRTWTNENLPT